MEKIKKFFGGLWKKVVKFWYFNFANPVVLKGGRGGFRWVFRRFWLEYSTVSGNWKMRITAGEHPYGYLLYGAQRGNDSNVHGFAATLYMETMLLTQDQGLVNDVQKAIKKYDKRVEAAGKQQERYDEAALEAVRQEQEFVELPKKERRKVERGINGGFKKVVKDVQEKRK